MTLESLPSNPDEISTSQVPNYDGAGVRTSVDGSSKGTSIKQKIVSRVYILKYFFPHY